MVSQTVLLLYIQKQKGVFQNMKKQKITNLLLTMALCASAVLSGCAASAANQSTTSSTPFEEAKDSGTPISSDEASSVQAYLPKPSAPSAGKVLDRIHEILLASRLKK